MEALEILDIIQQGESFLIQFKERLPHIDSLAHEMIAFSNTDGGKIIIGVNDKTGDLNGLSFRELQEANQKLVNAASKSVFPPIILKTETVKIDELQVLVVEIKEGISKPYKDRNGIFYVKNGSDKGKVASNEIARLLQSNKVMFADEVPVHGSSVAKLNLNSFKAFIHTKTGRGFDDLWA